MDLDKVKERFEADRFATENGAYIESLSEEGACVGMKLTPSHLNAVGTVMGGAIFTLADFAFAVAANHSSPVTVSTSASISFIAAARGDVLRAEARKIHRGKTACVFEVSVYCGDRLVAVSTVNGLTKA